MLLKDIFGLGVVLKGVQCVQLWTPTTPEVPVKPQLLIPRDLLDDLETFVLDHSAQIQHERCRCAAMKVLHSV